MYEQTVTPNMPDGTIQIFTKAPITGICKTRLAPHLGNENVVELQKKMIECAVRTASTVQGMHIQLWCQPDYNHPFFTQLLSRYSLTLHTQRGSDLGAIMNNAARHVADAQFPVIQIGTDCPSLTESYINQAREQLAIGNDIVIGPANDGGYVLMAMNRLIPGIFDNIKWGTSNVLKQLTNNISNGIDNFSMLPVLNDIDTIEDYLHWING